MHAFMTRILTCLRNCVHTYTQATTSCQPSLTCIWFYITGCFWTSLTTLGLYYMFLLQPFMVNVCKVCNVCKVLLLSQCRLPVATVCMQKSAGALLMHWQAGPTSWRCSCSHLGVSQRACQWVWVSVLVQWAWCSGCESAGVSVDVSQW